MAMIPFREVDRFWDDEFVPFFPALRMKMPPVDVSETENEVVVEMEAPGVDPKHIELSIEGNHLMIRGQVEQKQEERNKSYYRKEIRREAFERSVMLPTEVKAEEANASYANGVLNITVPKAEVVKPKRIEVKVQ